MICFVCVFSVVPKNRWEFFDPSVAEVRPKSVPVRMSQVCASSDVGDFRFNIFAFSVNQGFQQTAGDRRFAVWDCHLFIFRKTAC